MPATRKSSNSSAGGSSTDPAQNLATRLDDPSPGPNVALTSLEAALHRIDIDLTRAHVAFALIGGLAVSARTEPRFTQDADLAVAVASDAEAEALVHSLGLLDYHVRSVLEQEAAGRLATVRLACSADPQPPVVDLLFAHPIVRNAQTAQHFLTTRLPSSQVFDASLSLRKRPHEPDRCQHHPIVRV